MAPAGRLIFFADFEGKRKSPVASETSQWNEMPPPVSSDVPEPLSSQHEPSGVSRYLGVTLLTTPSLLESRGFTVLPVTPSDDIYIHPEPERQEPGIRNCCFASDFRTVLKRQNTALNNEVLKFEFRDPEGVSV
jgi:hypothetical protein